MPSSKKFDPEFWYRAELPHITSTRDEPPPGLLPDGTLNVVKEDDLPDMPLPPQGDD